MTVRAGSLADLRTQGQLLTKVDRTPVVVFWHEGRPAAVEDRCPHMGFPLHQGTVDDGLVTCHWHHARFDLSSGCTLDPWADDARGFDVSVEAGEVWVTARPGSNTEAHLRRRLQEGLEEDLTLVVAKAVLALGEAGVPAREIVAQAARFGLANRRPGWGAGMTVLTAVAGVLDRLDAGDRDLALTQALSFLARDVSGHPPRFPLEPMGDAAVAPDRSTRWFRRFVETRSADAAERVLATAAAAGASQEALEAMLFGAATDHVFIDEGHQVDFVNKAFELAPVLASTERAPLLASLVPGLAAARRGEELSSWRHPHDLAALAARTELAPGRGRPAPGDEDVVSVAEAILDREPEAFLAELVAAADRGASAEQLARGVAYAAALRLVRFHTQNDHADWNSVHHALTSANAIHQAVARQPSAELGRGIVHGALRVYLDRFLNVPPARVPDATTGSLEELAACWDRQGAVEEAGRVALGFLRGGGDPDELVAALGHALFTEDAGFHWYQVYEASVRQLDAWPPGSAEGQLILVGLARFLAAHTPTRRERARVVDIARRLHRGHELFADAG